MSRRFGVVVSTAAVLFTLAGCSAPAAQPLAALDNGMYSGPLMGYRQLIDTVPIDNEGTQPIRLNAAAPTDPHNVAVLSASVVPVDESAGIEGVLRWPRPSAEKDPAFNVLQRAAPVSGFRLPVHSREKWALALVLRQPNITRSMRASGITVHYTAGGQEFSLVLTQGFCFSAPADTRVCKAIQSS